MRESLLGPLGRTLNSVLLVRQSWFDNMAESKRHQSLERVLSAKFMLEVQREWLYEQV